MKTFLMMKCTFLIEFWKIRAIKLIDFMFGVNEWIFDCRKKVFLKQFMAGKMSGGKMFIRTVRPGLYYIWLNNMFVHYVPLSIFYSECVQHYCLYKCFDIIFFIISIHPLLNDVKPQGRE